MRLATAAAPHATTPTAEELTLYRLQQPEVIASPWSYYARLQTAAPVHFDPYLQSWLLSRHADVAAVLADARFSVEMQHESRLVPLVPDDESLKRAFRYLDRHISFVDPPEHTRIRATLAAPFKPRHVRLLEGWVSEVVDDTLQELRRTETPDVVRDLAAPVPLRVIAEMLGLDGVELMTVRRWSTAWGDLVGAPGHLPTGNREPLLAIVDELVERLKELVADHRRTGRRDTVTGALVQAVAAGELTEDELVSNLLILLTAGNETTTNLITNSILALIGDPDLWAHLSADPTLLPAAIEELARVHPSTQYTARRALEDVEIGGHEIRRGQSVVLMLAAANRDPDVFDDPDAIRLDRPNTRRHLAFGNGPHFCFGAPLARLEIRLVLDGLLSSDRLELAGPMTWRLNSNLRGLASLPVQWATRSGVATSARRQDDCD